jgi:uncharacterized protein (DUF305 family)
MRHPIRFTIITVSLALSTLAFAHDPKPSADPSMKMDAPHSTQMANMPMTGDQDHDFAMMMREHHQMALPMAEKEIKEGKNPEMRKMAQNIVKAQTKEIAQFDAWLAHHKK